MRRIGGAEMAAAYILLMASPYALWRWRRSTGMWMMVGFCLGMMMIYTIATPNMGNLVRFRYPYFTPIVGLGLAGWVALAHHLGIRWKLPLVNRI